MKTLFKNGQTSVIVRVMILDTSSAIGAGLTGVVFNTAGLNISTIADTESAATVYSTTGNTIETITTCGTFAAPTATKCRFKAVDATNHPGLYEIQIADARWAVSNAKSLIVHVTGVTGGYSAPAEVQLSAIDINDATAAGISRIDEAISAAKNVKAGGIARAAFATDTGLQCLRSNTAQSGSISTIQYDAGASAMLNFSVGCWVYITSGTGVGQVRMVQSYANATKTATISPNWDTAPDNTSIFAIIPASRIIAVDTAPSDSSGVTTLLTRIASALTITSGKVDVNDKTGFSLSAAGVQAIWDALTSALTTVGSVGKYIITSLSTYTGGDTAGTTTLLSRLTGPRATNLDNLDATVSSRSTYAGADTAGTTTLLSRIASALTITGGKVDVNDKTGFSLSPAGVQAIWDALTSALTTVGSVGKYIVTNLSTYAGGDTAGTTTLLARLTAQRASNLDFLDTAISGVKDAVWTVASRTLTAFGFTVNTNANATETDISNRLPAVLINGHMDSSIQEIGVAKINAAAFATAAITTAAIQDGALTRLKFNADSGLQSVRSNTAQAGATTTITLDAGASAVNDFYKNDFVYITGGTGAGQCRLISAYVGATKVATVTTWVTNPDATSTFAIIPFDAVASGGGGGGATAADIWTYATRTLTGFGFTGVEIEVLSPVLDSGDIELRMGYDYTIASGQPIVWNFTGLGVSLAGATVEVVHTDAAETSYGWTITITNAGQATQTVTAEATGAQTAALGYPGSLQRKPFRVKATLSGGAQRVLAEGRLILS